MTITEFYREFDRRAVKSGPVELESWLKDTLEAYRAEHPDDTRGIATIMTEMGSFYRVTGVYSDSSRMFTLAKLELEGAGLHESAEYADAINNMGALFRLTEEYERAGALFDESIDILRKLPDAAPELFSSSLNNYALMLQDTGEYARSAELYEEALDAVKHLKSGSLARATMLSNLAFDRYMLSERDKAIANIDESLEIFTAELGAEHPSTKSCASAAEWFRTK